MTQKTYIDATGQQVPAKYVKPYDKLRHQIAQTIAKDWLAEEARLAALKAKTLAAITKLQEAAAQSVDVKPLGGSEGNVQFRSFDGAITIRLDNAKKSEFDERLQLAQTLIMEAVREMAVDANADLVEIVTRAFRPRSNGCLDMARIRDLRNYQVSHPKWQQAIEIIGECERVVGHRKYVRVSIREKADQVPRFINLDIAAIP